MHPSKVPMYHQVFLVLRERILAAAYPAGSLLPGENSLARDFRVSPITSRRALAELEKAGLVERVKGRRPRVIGPPVADRIDLGYDNLARSNETIGATRCAILGFEWRRTPPDVAARLDCAPDDQVLWIERVRYLGDTPFCHVISYLPADVAKGITAARLADRMLVELLAENGHAVVEARQTIAASLAWPGVARKLDTEAGTALLNLKRVARSATGRAVEFVDACFRADLYSFDMQMGDARIDVGEATRFELRSVPIAAPIAASDA